MREVAEHLETEAKRRSKNVDDVNLFARSAFNRYYYATFLLARELMKKFRPSWRGSHSALPKELTGSILREIKQLKKKANRLHDWEIVSQCDVCIHHIHQLSELLESAYGLRVIADYEPEITATIDVGGTITLGDKKISDAKHWVEQAISLKGKIETFWDNSNGY